MKNINEDNLLDALFNVTMVAGSMLPKGKDVVAKMPDVTGEYSYYNWETLTHALMKISEDFDWDKYALKYMELYRSDIWAKYKNDEFEMREQLKNTVDLMKKNASAFPINKPFLVENTYLLGDYNFEKKGFSFKTKGTMNAKFNQYAQIVVENNFVKSPYPFNDRYTIDLYDNAVRVNPWISMGEEEAKDFINRRKKSDGTIDREFYGVYELKIEKKYSNFVGKFDKIRLYDKYSKKADEPFYVVEVN